MQITYESTPITSYALVTKSDTPLVSCHITIDLGPSDTVLTHVERALYCDLLLSGTDTMNREAFLDAVNGAGGSIAVRANEGRITITIETIASRLPKILTLVEQMLLTPAFLSKELHRAKRTYGKQLHLANEQARTMAHIHLLRSLYTQKDRVYPPTPDEEKAVVQEVTKTALQKLHQRLLHAPWCVTIGANARTQNRIQSAIARIRTKAKTPKPTSPILQNDPSVPLPVRTAKLLTHQISAQQNIEISIGQRVAITMDDAEYPALLFALAVLGRWGGFSGRLMSTVREKEGLTYGIYARAESSTSQTPGHWRIMTFFHPHKLIEGLTSVRREVQLLHTKGITPAELTRFKTILKTSHELLFDSLLTLTSTVHAYHIKKMSFTEYQAIMQAMQKLTSKEINTAIKKHIDPSTLSYSLAGNLEPLHHELITLRTLIK